MQEKHAFILNSLAISEKPNSERPTTSCILSRLAILNRRKVISTFQKNIPLICGKRLTNIWLSHWAEETVTTNI